MLSRATGVPSERCAAVRGDGTLKADLSDTPLALRDALGGLTKFEARFELPIHDAQLLLTRMHPIVEKPGATYVMSAALDPLGEGIARRCGAIRTKAVARRTTLLLVRLRYHIIAQYPDVERPLLAEDCRVLAFAGSPQSPAWLDEAEAERLVLAEPDSNIAPEQATDFIRKVAVGFEALRPQLEAAAKSRAEELLAAHQRVREAARLKGVRYRVEPQLPPGVLGVRPS